MGKIEYTKPTILDGALIRAAKRDAALKNPDESALNRIRQYETELEQARAELEQIQLNRKEAEATGNVSDATKFIVPEQMQRGVVADLESVVSRIKNEIENPKADPAECEQIHAALYDEGKNNAAAVAASVVKLLEQIESITNDYSGNVSERNQALRTWHKWYEYRDCPKDKKGRPIAPIPMGTHYWKLDPDEYATIAILQNIVGIYKDSRIRKIAGVDE